MSKQKKLKKKLNAFVDQLTPDEVREQLVLAYLQMERCLQVLRGEDVEPVTMKGNGLSSDLELFYMCKKKAEELALLNNEEVVFGKSVLNKVCEFALNPKRFVEYIDKTFFRDEETKLIFLKECPPVVALYVRYLGEINPNLIKFHFDIDNCDFERDLDKIRKTFEKFKDDIGADKFSKMCEELCRERKSLFDPIGPVSEETAKSLDDILKDIDKEIEKFSVFTEKMLRENPRKETLDSIMKLAREWKFKPKLKFQVGDKVYFIEKEKIHKEEVEKVLDDHAPYDFLTSSGRYLKKDETFATLDELLNHLKENVNEEE